jgi:Leucine-rich repeat (LRR) protein
MKNLFLTLFFIFNTFQTSYSQNKILSYPIEYTQPYLYAFYCLDSLKELDSIKNLNYENIYYVNLSNSELIELPNKVFKLDYLVWLLLDNNNISFLPIEINQLEYLKKLDISNNPISSLPKHFNLKYLAYLNVSNTNLNLVETIELLQKKYSKVNKIVLLTLIDKPSNKSILWVKISNKEFIELINKNQLNSSYFNSIFEEEILDLSNCRIDKIPNWIYKFTNLKVLKLNNNPIKILPKELNLLTSLQYLVIDNNFDVEQLSKLQFNFKTRFTKQSIKYDTK